MNVNADPGKGLGKQYSCLGKTGEGLKGLPYNFTILIAKKSVPAQPGRNNNSFLM